jgi:lipopolysaccharide/colanic/teichoic acid biosynthesis glycosyltransferase
MAVEQKTDAGSTNSRGPVQRLFWFILKAIALLVLVQVGLMLVISVFVALDI